MELLAVIEGLEAIRILPSKVMIYSDSKYVVDSVNLGWVLSWEKVGFKKKKNPDLWRRFLIVYRKHNVSFTWVKGHANIPENERCDRLAVEASLKENLPPDRGYEIMEDNRNDLF